MKKFVLVPDSFKGTLSSLQVCEGMEQAIKKFFPDAEVRAIPIADGGGKRITAVCKGPFMQDVSASYALLPDQTAVIEVASAAGLPMAEGRKNVLQATTYGVGQLILNAAEGGAKNILLCLGGSCTNDFGCGAAHACGVRFFDRDGKSFLPVGKTLKEIAEIDVSGLSPLLNGVRITAICDVDNLPYGQTGAAYVFAPQKGADGQAVALLDKGVRHTCDTVKRCLGKDVSSLQGGGAAGAMGAGAVAFFGAQLKMGIQTVLETVRFEEAIRGADVIFTGEGKLDGQSLRGKAVLGVARAAKVQKIPVICVVGGAEGDLSAVYEQGVTAVFTINRLPQDFAVSRHLSAQNLAFTMENILRLLV